MVTETMKKNMQNYLAAFGAEFALVDLYEGFYGNKNEEALELIENLLQKIFNPSEAERGAVRIAFLEKEVARLQEELRRAQLE